MGHVLSQWPLLCIADRAIKGRYTDHGIASQSTLVCPTHDSCTPESATYCQSHQNIRPENLETPHTLHPQSSDKNIYIAPLVRPFPSPDREIALTPAHISLNFEYTFPSHLHIDFENLRTDLSDRPNVCCERHLGRLPFQKPRQEYGRHQNTYQAYPVLMYHHHGSPEARHVQRAPQLNLDLPRFHQTYCLKRRLNQKPHPHRPLDKSWDRYPHKRRPQR